MSIARKRAYASTPVEAARVRAGGIVVVAEESRGFEEGERNCAARRRKLWRTRAAHTKLAPRDDSCEESWRKASAAIVAEVVAPLGW